MSWSEWMTGPGDPPKDYKQGQNNDLLRRTQVKEKNVLLNPTNNRGLPRGYFYGTMAQIDDKKPTGSFSPNSRTTWDSSASLAVKFNPSDDASGVKNWTYQTRYIQGKEKVSTSGTWSSWSTVTAKPSNGNITLSASNNYNTIYQIRCRVTDNVGNQSDYINSGYYYFDRVNPTGSFSPNSSDWTNKDIPITVTVSDNQSGIASHTRTNGISTDGGSTWSWNSNTTATYTSLSHDFPMQGEGLRRARLEIDDKGGNTATVYSGTYKVDKSPPTAPKISPSATGWTNKNITFTISGSSDSLSGVWKYQYQINGTSGSWIDYSSAVTISATGTHTIYARALDNTNKTNMNSANISSISSTVVRIDKSLPEGIFEPNSCDWTNQDVPITATVSDTHSLIDTYSRTNGTSYDGGSTWTWNSNTTATYPTLTHVFPMQTEGLRRARLDISDKAGNSTTVYSGIYKIDKSPPTTPTVLGTSTAWTNQNATFTIGGSTDSLSGVWKYQYQIDGTTGIWRDYATAVTYSTEGTHRIYARALDNTNKINENTTNISTNTSVEVNIDKSPPTAPQVSATTTGWTNQNITFSIGGSTDSLSGVWKYQYQIDSTSGTWKDYSTPVTFTTEGAHTIYARALDVTNQGNLSSTNISSISSLVVKIDKSPPTNPKINASTTAWTNQDIVFSVGESIDSLSGVWKYQYQIDSTSGSWKDYSSPVTFTTEGVHTIYARSLDVTNQTNLNAANISSISSVVLKIDKRMPVLSLTPDPAWQGSLGSAKITIIASDDSSGVNYVKFGGTSSTLDIGSNVSLSDNGSFKSGTVNVTANGTYYFTISDVAGNKKVFSCVVSSFDLGAPNVTITPLSRSWATSGGNGPVLVAIKVDDMLSGIKTIIIQARSKNSTTGAWSAWTNYAIISDSEIGTNTSSFTKNIALDANAGEAKIWQIQASAVDRVNNTSAWIGSDATVGYQIDKVLPLASLSANNLAWSNAESYSINITPTDQHSGMKQWSYQIRSSINNKATWTSWTPVNPSVISGNTSKTILLAPQEGAGTIYQVKYNLMDNAGNTSGDRMSGDFCFDRIPPSGTFTPNSCAWRNSNLSVTFQPSDLGYSGVSKWRYRTSNNNGKTYGAWCNYINGDVSSSILISSEGYHVIQAEVVDHANNKSVIESGQYLIDKTAPKAKNTITRVDTQVSIDIYDIIEELSGIDTIYVDIMDKDDAGNFLRKTIQLVSKSNNYREVVTLPDTLKSVQTLAFHIYLVDKAGNVKILTDETVSDFTVHAIVQSLEEPYDSTFSPTQQGRILISLTGYVEKVYVAFEDPFHFNGNIQDAEHILLPQESDETFHYFIVPQNCPEGQYKVEITAFRKGESKTVYVDLYVQNLGLNRIRTRIRSH